MSKRTLKIMKLFKLAQENESKLEGILIDKEEFLKALKGLGDSEKPVKIEPVTV